MRFLSALLPSLLALPAAASFTQSWHKSGPNYVTLGSNGRFAFNGSEFPIIGTTAYWLPALNKDEDIDYALGNISSAGFNAVRTWAFNDVTSIPENGTWFQLITNRGLFINNGPNGLQKLDTVVRLAEKHHLFLILTLTNNWNPEPADSIVNLPINFTTRNLFNPSLQRNFLSNQYGGMDVYVRQLGDLHLHDQFYLNKTLINAFKNYTTHVVKRYRDCPNVLSWEIANDPRCKSTLRTSEACATTTVTRWHSNIAKHVKTVDPNHLVSSGTSGYFCPDCPKIFQKKKPSPPTVSPIPSPSTIARRRLPKPLTKKSLLNEKWNLLKRVNSEEAATRTGSADVIRIRGRWLATPTKRQQGAGVGPAFNGASGVDSEDILAIPQVGFGSFQLFPDQYQYGLVEPSGPLTANESLQVGLNWIQQQADSSKRNGKPIILTSFGLVTQNNAAAFVPFNASAPVIGTEILADANPQQQASFGVSDQQRDQTYAQWIEASLRNGLAGVIHYQWGQPGLSVQPGTPVSSPSNQTGVSTVQNATGVSPNDGYSIQGVGSPQFVQVVQQQQAIFGANPA
ncbi:hypothetical protein APHAL10511_001179 [Amanita phalloides]|nr:hypothetical protein APHAL10511_001179 [Amanita phalloides]